MACPTIAVLDGPAMGGGLELSMCADIRIATKGVIMSLPETSLAIIPGAGGTQRLPRIVGVPKAKELIFTGARLDAVEGHSIGLVNHIADDFQQAMELAMKIAD